VQYFGRNPDEPETSLKDCEELLKRKPGLQEKIKVKIIINHKLH
jgi:hypothetical protein